MTLVDWMIVVVLAAGSAGRDRARFLSFGIFAGRPAGGPGIGGMELLAGLPHLLKHVDPFHRSWPNAIAFLLIALLVMIAAAILGSLLAKLFQKGRPGMSGQVGWGDLRLCFKELLFVTVCILVTVAFFPKAEWLLKRGYRGISLVHSM